MGYICGKGSLCGFGWTLVVTLSLFFLIMHASSSSINIAAKINPFSTS